MYESLKGNIIEKTPAKAVVDIHGLRYRLAIGLNTFSRLPEISQTAELFLSLIVREDSHTLYAFLTAEERDLFETLITISGIGPKTALSITGHLELEAFQNAIASSNVTILSKIPGIGKKTAEKLLIEMRDKFKGIKKGKMPSVTTGNDTLSDATNALINLGYNFFEAQRAVKTVLGEKKEEKDLAKIIAFALQKI